MTWVAIVVAVVVAVAAAVAVATRGAGGDLAAGSASRPVEVSSSTVERDVGSTATSARGSSTADATGPSTPAATAPEESTVGVQLTPTDVEPEAIEGAAPTVAPPADESQATGEDDDDLDQLVEEHLDEEAAAQAAAEDELGDVEPSPDDGAGIEGRGSAQP